MKKSYPAFIFRQRKGAPLQVAFVAASSEIDLWARVPTKRTGDVRNFQRAELAKHSVDITKFFSNSENSSPTAVVVGFDPIRSENRVVTRDAQGVVDSNLIEAGEPVVGTIQIEWGDPADCTSPSDQIARMLEVVPSIRRYIYSELQDIAGFNEGHSEALEKYIVDRLDAGFEPDVDGPENDEEDGRSDGQDGEFDGDAMDSGILGEDAPPAVQEILSGLSPSERQVVLGRLLFLASLRRDPLERKSPEMVSELFRLVMDELKPGILIDGQHRVMGTKKIGNIPFLVTALPLADWSELAFQFIVTNRTAKRVPESLLISIVGNSLSKSQRAQIEERLREAGIRVGLIEAVMQVHEDEQSPFFGYLAFGLKSERGFLDAAAMRGKVVQPWFERQGPIQYLFDHFCEGKRKAERTDYWKSEELWFQYFVAFWSAVKARYVGANVFSAELIDQGKRTPYSKLMTATVLMIFQDAVLRHLQEVYTGLESAQKTPVSAHIQSDAHFHDIVKNTLQKLSPDFFTDWQLSGFDGSKGARDDLQEAITLVIGGKKTVAQLRDKKKPHRLFKEQSK